MYVSWIMPNFQAINAGALIASLAVWHNSHRSASPFQALAIGMLLWICRDSEAALGLPFVSYQMPLGNGIPHCESRWRSRAGKRCDRQAIDKMRRIEQKLDPSLKGATQGAG